MRVYECAVNIVTGSVKFNYGQYCQAGYFVAKCQQSGGSAAEQIGRGLPEAIRGVVNGGIKKLFVVKV